MGAMVNSEAETTRGGRLLLEILDGGIVRDASGTVITLDSQVSRATGERLQHLIRSIAARHTLEVGLAYGISALYICQALADTPGARHIVIDPDQNGWWRGIGLRHLREAGLDGLVDFREQPAHQAIPKIEREGARIDLALIDGWHTFDYTLIDLFLVDRILRKDGVIVLDDVEWPGVRKACRYFLTNRGYRVVECWDAPARPARRWTRDVLVTAARSTPWLRRGLKPELLHSDATLGLTADCRSVALQKTTSRDNRGCFDHCDF